MDELHREFGLRISRIPFAVERLAMEVGDVDRIGIDDRQRADTRPGERRDDRAADATRTDDRDSSFLEPPLP